MNSLANAMLTGLKTVEKALEQNRRCEKCDRYTNYIESITYCPKHGGYVREYPAPSCDCGAKMLRGETFCTQCGREIQK